MLDHDTFIDDNTDGRLSLFVFASLYISSIYHLNLYLSLGSVQTYSKLVHDIAGQDFHVDRQQLHHLSTCVIPEYDPITMIDTQSGLIQRITCDSSHLSMQLSCHMIEGTLCNLLQHCGDPHLRRFASCVFEHKITTLSEDLFDMIFVHLDMTPSTLANLLITLAILVSLVRYKINIKSWWPWDT
jgi:hypothetical protein